MVMLPLVVVAVGAVVLVGCSHPQRGLHGFEGSIAMHTTEASGKESEFSVTAKGDVLRIDVPPPSPPPAATEVTLGHAVYDHATNKVRIFFDTTKEYREMDLGKRIAGDAAETTPPLVKTNVHKVVAGMGCDEWSVKGGGGGHTEVCLAPGLAYLEIFHVQLGPHGTESPLAKEYREHGTFPLELIDYDAQGKEQGRTFATKIVRASVDGDVFALPDTYKKVEPHFGKPAPRSSQ